MLGLKRAKMREVVRTRCLPPVTCSFLHSQLCCCCHNTLPIASLDKNLHLNHNAMQWEVKKSKKSKLNILNETAARKTAVYCFLAGTAACTASASASALLFELWFVSLQRTHTILPMQYVLYHHTTKYNYLTLSFHTIILILCKIYHFHMKLLATTLWHT